MSQPSAPTPKPGERASEPGKGKLQWDRLAKGHDRNLVSLERPVAVTIACVSNVIVAIVMIALVLALDNARFKNWFAANEISPTVYFASLYVIAVFSLVSAFGMWEGARWGWWIMMILQVYCFVDIVGGMIMNATLLRSSVEQMSNPIRFAKDAAYSALWFLYFFTDAVLAYFQCSQKRKVLVALGVISIGAAIAGLKLAIAAWLRGV
jgi:hypothetical protein